MRNRIAVITAAVAAAWLAPSDSAYAQAKGLEVRLSGQVNRALMNVDDGHKSNAFFVDNGISGTRFRLSASAPMTAGLKAGAVFETEFMSNPSGDVSFDQPDIAAEFNERHMDVFFEGGFGKVSLGQGDGGANGAMEVDLSGTSVAHWSNPSSIGGGFEFKTAGGVGTDVTIGDVISNQDFESRYDRVRYDTPGFGGFRAAASWGTKDGGRDVRELALRYSGDMGALGRLAAALGWSNQQANVAVDPTAVEDEFVGGSVSWLHGSGLNLTLAHNQRDSRATGDEAKITYAKVGYKFGQHAVSLDWGKGEEQTLGTEGDVIGLGYVWKPIAWAEIYAAAKRHGLDVAGVDADDIDIFMVGSRIRF